MKKIWKKWSRYTCVTTNAIYRLIIGHFTLLHITRLGKLGPKIEFSQAKLFSFICNLARVWVNNKNSKTQTLHIFTSFGILINCHSPGDFWSFSVVVMLTYTRGMIWLAVIRWGVIWLANFWWGVIWLVEIWWGAIWLAEIWWGVIWLVVIWWEVIWLAEV